MVVSMGVLTVVLAFGWDLRELAKVRLMAERSVNSPEQTKAFYREDSAPLYSYSYDSLQRPAYFLSGVVDYHLESRLLRTSDFGVLPDPLLATNRRDQIVLATRPNPLDGHWLVLEPNFRLAPGERQLWKFAFVNRSYRGVLIGQGPGGFYREYDLPPPEVAGNRSFGVEPARSKELAFWNSTVQPQDFALTFLLPAPITDFGDFATVAIERYRSEELQIRTLGLIPYHAQVRTAAECYLETPRVYIPGYRARVDGNPEEVAASPQHLVMVKLKPGVHDVVVSFRPTPKLSAVGLITALGWLGLAAWGLDGLRRRRAISIVL
jgi:hypothetical protein